MSNSSLSSFETKIYVSFSNVFCSGNKFLCYFTYNRPILKLKDMHTVNQLESGKALHGNAPNRMFCHTINRYIFERVPVDLRLFPTLPFSILLFMSIFSFILYNTTSISKFLACNYKTLCYPNPQLMPHVKSIKHSGGWPPHQHAWHSEISKRKYILSCSLWTFIDKIQLMITKSFSQRRTHTELYM